MNKLPMTPRPPTPQAVIGLLGRGDEETESGDDMMVWFGLVWFGVVNTVDVGVVTVFILRISPRWMGENHDGRRHADDRDGE